MIWIVPSCRKNGGTGHLVRSVRLCESLGDRACLCLPRNDTSLEYGIETLKERFPGIGSQKVIPLPPGGFPPEDATEYIKSDTKPLVLLDLRETAPGAFRQWLALTSGITGIDEGGRSRKQFPYLIDLLGTGGRGGLPNIRLSPVDRPAATGSRSESNEILVSFGGEDPAGLSRLTVRTLIKAGVAPERITVLLGALNRNGAVFPPGVRTQGPLPSLSGYLPRFGTLITAYGLTAWEGAATGLRVILLNPSRYHRSLGREGGFLTDPAIRKLSASTCRMISLNNYESSESPFDDRFQDSSGLIQFIQELNPSGLSCPCCGKSSGLNPAVLRKPNGTFFRCPRSRMLHFVPFSKRGQSEYSEEYFFEQYRKQYGRTYLEDFGTIKNFGRSRVAHIVKMSGNTRGPLLDIGCAYGPFLAAAAEAGFEPFGIDVAEEPVRYVRETLGFPAEAVFFPGTLPRFAGGPERFSVVTLWFVIEHFENLVPVWERIGNLMQPGGILAFSTPNGRGISALKNRKKFLLSSPEDHFSVMDPRSVRKILKGTPFRVRKIVVTGHHPERFFPSLDPVRHPRLMKLLGVVSRLFRLGDTFEVYAEKKGRR